MCAYSIKICVLLITYATFQPGYVHLQSAFASRHVFIQHQISARNLVVSGMVQKIGYIREILRAVKAFETPAHKYERRDCRELNECSCIIPLTCRQLPNTRR